MLGAGIPGAAGLCVDVYVYPYGVMVDPGGAPCGKNGAEGVDVGGSGAAPDNVTF
jgi:hypothetical protein